MKYPLCNDEGGRLGALHDLHILDTGPEPSFDSITENLQDIFGVPVTVISLIDKERQWFKSVVGLDVCETDRDVAFCNYTVASGEFFEVTDAAIDPRFHANPLVTQAPGIRYYCGAPIFSAHQAIGSLCLIDMEARKSLGPKGRRILERFAEQVARELEVRRLLKAAAGALLLG
ncbi:GAF domain-containing protein [Congregibacter sp.]|uniref:GAF domain-containing protein n=1 Tax=Congregibacter sp. TaxID=2744308 RepID=UPI003F6AE191